MLSTLFQDAVIFYATGYLSLLLLGVMLTLSSAAVIALAFAARCKYQKIF